MGTLRRWAVAGTLLALSGVFSGASWADLVVPNEKAASARNEKSASVQNEKTAVALNEKAAAIPQNGNTAETQNENAAGAQKERAAAGGRSVTDETGRHMTIPANVQRIVSLAPNLTEIVYDLGAADRLVGDTDYCDTPPEAKLKPHVGNPQHPSLEAIVALHPDVVLATTSINYAETADTLLKLGIAVYTSDPHTVRGMLDSLDKIGDLIGAKTQGDALEANLRARLDALQARLADKPLAHVLFLVWISPPMSIGSNTFIADALRWAGAESVLVTDQNWPQPSIEEVLRIEPDYIVLTPDHGGSATGAEELRSRAEWKDLEAVRLGRVVTVSDGIERPSPGMVDAIEELAREVHPEVFAGCQTGVAAEAACAH